MDIQGITLELTQLHADLCAALADPRRILILYILSDAPHNVTELAKSIGLSQPTTSRHLKILRERGIVLTTRHGARVEYRLADERLIDALDLLRSVLRDRLTHRASLIDAAISR